MMTKEEILNMPAGREMDALVGEVIMGWEKDWWYNWKYKSSLDTFNPTTSISAAWEVVEKMKKEWCIDLATILREDYEGWITHWYNDYGKIINAEAETAPLAICRAALLAMMGD